MITDRAVATFPAELSGGEFRLTIHDAPDKFPRHLQVFEHPVEAVGAKQDRVAADQIDFEQIDGDDELAAQASGQQVVSVERRLGSATRWSGLSSTRSNPSRPPRASISSTRPVWTQLTAARL